MAGGDAYGSSAALSSAQLFDPRSDTFVPTGPLTTIRTGHSATRLLDGRVLIAGGADICNSANLSSAEIYDPATASFTATGSMAVAQEHQTATLLDDGRVLVVGGEGGCVWGTCATIGTAELFDPDGGRFGQTGSPRYARAYATATLLPDGRVLLAGGDDKYGDSVARAEVYDPTTGKFILTGAMQIPRSGHTATALPDGKVLILGGYKDVQSSDAQIPIVSVGAASAEVYDPSTGKFSLAAKTPTTLAGHTATLLPNGTVLIAGGDGTIAGVDGTSAVIYDPASARFTAAAPLATARSGAIAIRLLDGRVLILEGDRDAGFSGSSMSTAEIYQP